jgi:hypothetical protein
MTRAGTLNQMVEYMNIEFWLESRIGRSRLRWQDNIKIYNREAGENIQVEVVRNWLLQSHKRREISLLPEKISASPQQRHFSKNLILW